MRILFLTQYFPPEPGAPQNRLLDSARLLTEFGNQITVLTALPNYPKGEIYQGYRGQRVVRERVGEIEVIRTWIYVPRKMRFVRRLVHYFSFVISSVLLGTSRVGPQEVVMVESPPLFLGISGLIISWVKRAQLVFNVSDLWPESAVALGVIRNRFLVKLSTWLEEFIYRHSVLITGQTQGIVQNIGSRFPSKPVALITNGVDAGIFSGVKQADLETKVKKELGVEGAFVVGYAGLHGLAQGLETAIEAAQILSPHTDIVFLLLGDGPEKANLERVAETLKLRNVHFYPGQPREKILQIIPTFDVALIPLRKLALFKGALPSKMFEAMAAAVPVVVSVDGEARILVEKAQAGICVEPGDPQAMADAILRLYRDREYQERLGQNGRNYVLEHFDRRKITGALNQLLLKLHGSEAHP